MSIGDAATLILVHCSDEDLEKKPISFKVQPQTAKQRLYIPD